MTNFMWKKKSLMWSKDLSVGNAIIDAEHRNLICMADDVVKAIGSRDLGNLSNALETMKNWLASHFVNEERIAQAINFNFSNHRLARDREMNELRFIEKQLLEPTHPWPIDAVDYFTHFFRRLIIDDHIIELDMRMKPMLQAYGYDFWPSLKRDSGRVIHLHDGSEFIAGHALA